MADYQYLIDRADRRLRAVRIAKTIVVAGPVIAICAVLLGGCCTSTLQRGCDPMTKWRGYSLELAP